MDDEGIEGLTPIFEIAGDRHIMLTPQLAGISRSELGTKIANLAHCREAIIAALDLLITGI